MVVLQLNLQPNMAPNLWGTVAQPVPEDMAVVLNQHRLRSGVLLLRRVTETALVVTRAKFYMAARINDLFWSNSFQVYFALSSSYGLMGSRDMKFWWHNLISAFVLWSLI